MPPSTDIATLPNTALANDAGLAGFCNASMTADEQGWTVIPFGMWPHEKGLQNFHREQAEAIVAAFQSTWAKLKRAVVGLPVYKGHPDVPGLENTFPDKTEYGQVADMEVRDNGLAIKQILSSEGAKLVRSGWKFISPFWDAKPTGTRSGVIEWSPFKIFSVGLVKKPNIPNLSLANNATDFMNKADLIALFKLPTDASDEAVKNAVTQAALANGALANAETAASEAKTKLAEAEGLLATEKSRAETAATALANERKARITALVDDAVKVGRIPAADRKLVTTRLETSFDTESVALANMKPTLKTSATTEQEALAALNAKLSTMSETEKREYVNRQLGMANDGGDDMGAMDNDAKVKAISALVAAEKESPACKAIESPTKRHDRAYANVKAAHPKLFADPQASDDE